MATDTSDGLASTSLAEWTEPAAKSEGRDHLGMQAASVALYAALVPGITNVTLRARYYSFYPWLVDQYARSKGDTDERVWIRFIRRAEALLALASCAASPSGNCDGVGGYRWAVRTWKARSKEVLLDFATPAEPSASPHYLDATKGAFGQAYWSVLRGLGILRNVATHDIPVATEAWGDRLARAFAQSIAERGDQFMKLMESGTASQEELKRVGAAFSPDALPDIGEERDALVQLFFGADAPGIDSMARCDSLTLALHVARAIGRHPSADDVRWILYAGQTEGGAPVAVPAPLLARREQWQAYQANELAHIAVEAFLAELLVGLSEDTPTPVARATEQLVRKASSSWQSTPTWRQLRETIALSPNAADRKDARSERALSTIAENGSGPERLTNAIRLVATLDARWEGTSDAVARVFGPATELGARFSGSIVHLLRFVRERDGEPVTQLVADLVQRWVIERHLSVALRKLRNQGKETFHFELIDGQLRRRRMAGPVFTNPRLSTSLRFLADLHLVNKTGLASGATARLDEAA